MSFNNRKNEYNRLIKLGREKDIPSSLLKEFKPKESQAPKVIIPIKKVKKNGK